LEGRAALPWDVVDATKQLAQLWHEPVSAVSKQLLTNLRQLLSPLDAEENGVTQCKELMASQ